MVNHNRLMKPNKLGKETSMRKIFYIGIIFAVTFSMAMLSALAFADDKPCDRACMKGFADQVLKSMVAHNPSVLPLAKSYAATENSEPAALAMMSLWRTVTGIKQTGQYVIDTQSGQIFFTAVIDESGMPSIFMGRLKIENHTVSELELYINRSRADSGFLFQTESLGKLPDSWTSPIPQGKKATREELLRVGRAIFNTSLPAPQVCSDCIFMEMGGIVYEDPDYLKAVDPYGDTKEKKPVAKKLVTIPCGLIPTRPGDPKARVAVIDEEQGIVISFGVVNGMVSPYLLKSVTETCFVPDSMIAQHREYLNGLNPADLKDRNILREMPASVNTIEMIRFYSNQIQGMHRLMNLQGPGAGSPWVSKEK
jgi:hypothetical protein